MPRVFRPSWIVISLSTLLLASCSAVGDLSNLSLPKLSTAGETLGARVSEMAIARNVSEVPQVDSDRLFGYVETLAFPRDDLPDRRRARQYLLETLTEAGWSPKLQAFEGGANLVATRPGSDPEAGTILVGAHYDTVAGSPGADDNASGVATVLELAQLLGEYPSRRRLTVVLFDREEDGLLGSLNFVSPDTTTDLRGAIVLEMTGYACYEVGCQTYPSGLRGDFPETGDFLGVVGNTAASEVVAAFENLQGEDLPDIVTLTVPFNGVAFPDLLRSDHAPFWLAGVGAVMVTDTANFRNPHYHRSSDTPETIDRPFLTGNAQAIVTAIAGLLEESRLNESKLKRGSMEFDRYHK
ncbi:M28 family peptidase [Baaleninema sp.]|uniref:M28 family peptidase n=1 Tax=Baaleninema sp. TaxID=3101197 RepID=UPI003D082110